MTDTVVSVSCITKGSFLHCAVNGAVCELSGLRREKVMTVT